MFILHYKKTKQKKTKQNKKNQNTIKIIYFEFNNGDGGAFNINADFSLLSDFFLYNDVISSCFFCIFLIDHL